MKVQCACCDEPAAVRWGDFSYCKQCLPRAAFIEASERLAVARARTTSPWATADDIDNVTVCFDFDGGIGDVHLSFQEIDAEMRSKSTRWPL